MPPSRSRPWTRDGESIAVEGEATDEERDVLLWARASLIYRILVP